MRQFQTRCIKVKCFKYSTRYLYQNVISIACCKHIVRDLSSVNSVCCGPSSPLFLFFSSLLFLEFDRIEVAITFCDTPVLRVKIVFYDHYQLAFRQLVKFMTDHLPTERNNNYKIVTDWFQACLSVGHIEFHVLNKF